MVSSAVIVAGLLLLLQTSQCLGQTLLSQSKTGGKTTFSVTKISQDATGNQNASPAAEANSLPKATNAATVPQRKMLQPSATVQTATAASIPTDPCAVVNLPKMSTFDMNRFAGKWFGISHNRAWIKAPPGMSESMKQRSFQIHMEPVSKSKFNLKMASSAVNGGFCLYQNEEGNLPDPVHSPNKFEIEFKAWYMRTGWAQTFYILNTDYDGYAIIYACRDVFSDGKCNPSKAYFLTLSRFMEGHTNAELAIIDKSHSDSCIRETLEGISQTKACDFLPGMFPNSTSQISNPIALLGGIEKGMTHANPLIGMLFQTLGALRTGRPGLAGMLGAGGLGAGGLGMGGLGMGGGLGGLFGGGRAGGEAAEIDPMMQMMMMQMQQQNAAGAGGVGGAGGMGGAGGLASLLQNNPITQTMGTLYNNMGAGTFANVMTNINNHALNTAVKRGSRTTG